MKINRSLKLHNNYLSFDKPLLVAYIALCFIGLYMILNISSVAQRPFHESTKQFIWLIISGIMMFAAFRFVDLNKIRRYIPLMTIINLALLVLVLVFGQQRKGATRSFSVFGVNFQPSSTFRVMLVLYYAHVLDKKKELLPETKPLFFLKEFFPLITITVIGFIIILIQRHLSTVVISSMVIFSTLWIVRIRLITLVSIILIAALLLTGIIAFGPEYRNARMHIFVKYCLFLKLLNIHVDTEHIKVDDHQAKESIISLRGGGLIGNSSSDGLAKYAHLPESTTDYIFSVIGEEYGFIGAIFVFALYCLIFFRGVFGSWMTEDFFWKIAGIGLTLDIFYNVIVNIGVAMSALPSTGVTLPFISYGGTSLITNSITIGLILNITAERRLC